MFDEETAAFIRTAPALTGLDLATLPELLTRVHTWIAALRLRLAEENAAVPEPFDSDLTQLRRLARTYATYAVALRDDQSAGAAFVSANAYQLLHGAIAARVVLGETGTFLRRDTVSSDVSALLLYMAAGRTADAREMAEKLRVPERGTMASSLITALVRLCRGDLRRVVSLRTQDVQRLYNRGEDPATEALWQQLVLGLRLVAARLLGERLAGAEGRGRTPDDVFAAVEAAAVASLAPWPFNEREGDDEALYTLFNASATTYAGPHHVASLLRAATDRLLADAVIAIPTPPNVPEAAWRAHLVDTADRRRRPLLWQNHKEAIGAGLLHPGESAVISYPTGAGKSTLTELKIAATVLRGRRAIFLAPTRALVWQTYQALRHAFPDVRVTESPVGENTYEETESAADTAILVMTPERCLTFLGNEPEAFTDVGLIVFDECHLLHPREGVRDRRSLDAMLCFLGLLDVARNPDVLLLSAMMRNTEELAKWIAFATGRHCLEASTGWKPTRQVRGCLVYDEDEVDELQGRLVEDRRLARPRRRPPSAAVRRTAQLAPMGVFGLTQNWQPRVGPTGFALVPLLPDPITVGINAAWQLTPNKNEVAGVFAARMARAGIKVLVFVQNKDHCQSVCRHVQEDLGLDDTPLRLTPREQVLFDAAAEDLGDERLVIGPVGAAAAPHHGLLLAPERRLNESAFARADGVNVLVATPTLAQGMNLPAEAVLIVGDQRFDAAIGDRAQVAAHELLNAAGRAGRAGHHASGFVLVIPDRVIRVASDLNSVDPTLQQLNRALFSKADQCLEIADPVEILLDRVEVAVAGQDRLMRYFVTRLPVTDDGLNPAAVAARVLGRSLAAYRALARRDIAGFRTKLETALVVRQAIAAQPEQLVSIDQISSRTGYAPSRVYQLARALEAGGLGDDAGVLDWLRWTVAWLQTDPTLAADMLDPDALNQALTEDEVPDPDPEAAAAYAALLPVIEHRVVRWMSGAPLNELEAELHPPYDVRKRCKSAREFSGRFMVEFSHLAGTVAHVRRRQLDLAEEQEMLPVALSVLGACVRDGFATPPQLAVRYETDVYATSRIACHRLGDELAATTRGQVLSFGELRERAKELAATRGLGR